MRSPSATSDDFLPKQQFVMQDDFPDAAFGIGVLVAGFCFLVGATWIGAEWSQKTLMALLFWEPRRLKVFFTKIAVAVGAMALLATLAQLVWLGVGSYFASAKGTSRVTDDFWSDTFALQGRCVLLAVLLGLIGFGLANLIRNTGAALGIGFVYFILELIAMGIRPGWAGVGAHGQRRRPGLPRWRPGLHPELGAHPSTGSREDCPTAARSSCRTGTAAW